jgi:hypothetical protein
MTPLPASVVVATLTAAIVFAVILDFIKVPLFRRLKISWNPGSWRSLPGPMSD